jgi:ligand-binding sensor domain-containing protein
LKRFDGQEWTGYRDVEESKDRADRGIKIVDDGMGGVWAAHKMGTISHFDGQQWQSFAYQGQGLWDDRSAVVMTADQNGGVWVGHDSLVHVTWRNAAHSKVNWRAFSGRRFNWGHIRDVVVDNLGGVWIATNGWGLVRYADRTWTVYANIAGNASDRSQIVKALALDARGRLWATSGFYGVALFNGQTWQVHEGTGGLSGHRITQLVPDTAGGMWGLDANEHIFFLEEHSWWVYTQADGLPRQIYSAALNPVTGRVWVSTEEGFIRYDGPRWERLTLQ